MGEKNKWTEFSEEENTKKKRKIKKPFNVPGQVELGHRLAVAVRHIHHVVQPVDAG